MQFTTTSSSPLLALLFSTLLKTTTAQVSVPATAVFAPNSTVPTLNITFGSIAITKPATTISIKVPVVQPNLTLPSGLDPSSTYLALMLDFSVAGVLPNSNTTLLHWLQHSVSGSSLTSNTTALAPYGPPAPPPPSTHTYSIRIYKQPASFQLTPALTSYFANITAAIVNRVGFDDVAFVKDTGLGELVAENYFLVANETATTTGAPSATGTTRPLYNGTQFTNSGAAGVGGLGFGYGTWVFGLSLVGLWFL